MALQDFREVLAGLKEKFEEDKQTDTMQILEDINPNLSHASKSYKEGNRYIFKQNISYQDAQKIVEVISNTSEYSPEQIHEYKEKISNICRMIWMGGDSPITMMVYATKDIATQNAVYLSAVLDVLKGLAESDEQLVQSYEEILNEWNWNECIETVLKSIQGVRIVELAPAVYKVFEKNEVLRKEAAHTLIQLRQENYFSSILNLLVAGRSEFRQQQDELREIAMAMSTTTEQGSMYVYQTYCRADLSDQLAGNLIPAIRKNLTYDILDNIKKTLNRTNEESKKQKRLLHLLRNCKLNPKVVEILEECKDKKHLDQTMIYGAMGTGSFENSVEVLRNPQSTEVQKIDAIVQIGKSEDKRALDLLKQIHTNASVVTKVAIGAALIEQGKREEIGQLYGYLMSNQVEERASREALRQLRRLRSLRNEKITQELMNIATQLLERSKQKNNSGYIVRILELYEGGYPTNEIGEMFLKQLKEVNHPLVKEKCIAYLSKNLSSFSLELQAEIKKQFIIESQKSTVEATQAMRALTEISRGNDAVPTMGE